MSVITKKGTWTRFGDVIPSINRIVGKGTSSFVQQMTQELVDHTPVCTGFAQASWYASPGAGTFVNRISRPHEDSDGK